MLTNNAILDQLAKACPLPQESVINQSFGSDDEDEEEEEEESPITSRVRTQITEEQAMILKSFYTLNAKPKRDELQSIADQIGHTFKVEETK